MKHLLANVPASKLIVAVVLNMLLLYALRLVLMPLAFTTSSIAALPVITAVPISAPAEAAVGSAIPITVGPLAVPDDTRATLLAQDSYGLQVFHMPVRDGLAQFVLTGAETRHAGLLRLTATVGEARGSTSIQLHPGAPVGPVVPLVGPRSVAANARDWSMITVLPLDQFGNPAASGTAVEVRALHPDGTLAEQTVRVTHLLAWARLRSGTSAGRTTVIAQTEAAAGPEAALDEVAGPPLALSLSAEPATLPADGRQLLTVRTSPLRDRFGNTLPDGTRVTFIVVAPDGTRRSIPALTLDGRATAPLQAPATPGPATVRAIAAGVESASLPVEFTPGPAVGVLPLSVHRNEPAGALRLTAGPLTGALGQHIPDGTMVQFMLYGDDDQRSASAPTEGGYAQADIRLAGLPAGSYTIAAEVGATRSSIRVELE